MAYPVEQSDPTKVVGRRVVAVLLDALLVLVPTMLLLTARFEYLDVDDLDTSADQYCDAYMDQADGICVEVDDRVYFSDDTFVGAQGYYLVSSVVILVVLQGLTGWTPGKLITGIRVRRSSGGPPGIGKAALRWVLWIADGFPYVIPGLTAFIVALSSPGHRRIGDMVADTFVVKRAAFEMPLSLEEGGRLIVGEPAAVTVPAWAPPPSAPGAPASAAAPPVAAAAPSPTTEGPQWDEARGTYIQWDPTQQAWMQWDEGFKAWTRIPGQ
ncbi:MAG: RDD family protein [Acidimicrobiales bacterium]